MLDFGFPNLLRLFSFWGIAVPAMLLVGVPILIHLINMMRHRRVEWAAMEFLLVSQRKNRTWIILKQLLLLLLRMGVVAAVVLMIVGLARPQLVHARETISGQGVEIALALDISGSMASLDFEPDNRLEAAKDVIGRIQAAHELAKTGKRANIQTIVDAYADEPFWGVREQFAQALGDAQALREANRRLIAFDLDHDPADRLKELVKELD